MTKTFEFMYNDTWYKYEGGYIYRQDINDFYQPYCPVLIDLEGILNTFDTPQLQTIMAAIIHGFIHGKNAGRSQQINEFKRLFNID